MARQVYVWDAALYAGAGLVVVAVALLRRDTSRHGLALVRTLIPQSTGGWVRAGAIATSLAVAFGARTAHSATRDYTSLFVMWVAAVVAFAGTLVAAWIRVKGDGRPWLSRTDLWALVALVIAAGLVRCLALGRVPANLGGDEGTQLRDGLLMTARGLANPFATGWYSVPTMSFVAYGLAMRIFGATIAGGRALSAIVGTATVLTTFLLGRAVGGRRTGWVAAVVVAFSAYHIQYSRLASNQIIDPFIGTTALWLVWEALHPQQPRGRVGAWAQAGLPAWGLAGLVAGCGWYAYFGARWVSVLIALVVAWRALLDRTLLRLHWRGLLLFGAGWLVAALPLLGWYSVYPSALSERYNAVSIFASGWLEREIVITGKSALELLVQQVWRSFTAFHIRPDPTFWYRPNQPLVDFVTGALLLVGIVEAVARIRWPSRGLSLLWFGTTVTMAWVLTENPPSSQRGLLLVPAVALLVAWGLHSVVALFGARRKIRMWAMGTALAAIAVLNLVFYFGVYTPTRVYGNPSAEIATVFAQYVLENPEPICDREALGEARDPTVVVPAEAACPGRVYFLGPPYLYWDFGTLAFTLRAIPGQDVLPEEPLPEVTGPARFAVVPERVLELDGIRERYPGGRETALRAPGGQLLMIVYDWGG